MIEKHKLLKYELYFIILAYINFILGWRTFIKVIYYLLLYILFMLLLKIFDYAQILKCSEKLLGEKVIESFYYLFFFFL